MDKTMKALINKVLNVFILFCLKLMCVKNRKKTHRLKEKSEKIN